MALAEGMKNLVNDLIHARRSRHEFVKGNRQMAKALQEENKNFLVTIGEQNKMLAKQTHEFIKASREERKASYKQTMDSVHADLKRVRQASDAIVQGARELNKENREDSELAHKYWQSLSNDELVDELTPAKESSNIARETNKQIDKSISVNEHPNNASEEKNSEITSTEHSKSKASAKDDELKSKSKHSEHHDAKNSENEKEEENSLKEKTKEAGHVKELEM
jgi:hypothetical protein